MNENTEQSAADRLKENEEILRWAEHKAKTETNYVQRILDDIRREKRERRHAKR